jgi:polysaccharide chain length determinant protein (PEP-CTERM system associated)
LSETEHDIDEEGNLSETIDGALGLIARHRWLFLLVACAITLATVAVVSSLPNRYSSEATLVVEQPQVSQRYVDGSANMTVTDAIQAMTQEVLSRARLMGVIDEFGLYAKVKNNLAPEGLLALMRKDLAVEPLDEIRGNASAFKITFTTDNPQAAQAVTGRLTSLFIDWNVKRRGNQAVTTTNFFTEQLEAAKQRLKEQDEKQKSFKMQYLGELPERQSVNFEMLSDLRSQLQSTIAGLSRAQQQRMSLESALEESLARLQSERAKLLTRYTPRHSEVIQKDQEIEKVAASLKRFNTRTRESGVSPTVAVADDLSLGPLQKQVEANELETANLSREEQRLRAEIARYQNRLNLTPVREQQLAGILRDYDVYAQSVRDLQGKLLQARQSNSVEEHQVGQQFRLVDPPTLPLRPSGPKRLKISLGGVAGGIGLGLVLAFLADTRDSSFHSQKALSQLFALPLVLSVPLLLTPREERTRKWKKAFEWLAVSALTLTVFAAEFYIYRYG